MLPLSLRNWIFDRWIQPDETLERVPWVTPGDLVFLPKLGLDVTRKFLRNFYIYRSNIKENLKFSIAQFYPRSGYLIYYFFLFTWAEYYGVLPKLLEDPDLALIPESFMRYVIEIDREIDTKRAVALLESDPTVISSHPWLSRFREQLWRTIERSSLSVDVRSLLLREISSFENTCRQVCYQNMIHPMHTLDGILTAKENTVGALFAAWNKLLNLVYEISPENDPNSGQIFWNTGMALQMLDDTVDVPIDLENQTDNVFLCLVKENKAEWIELEKYLQYLKTTPWKHLDTAWANQHAPHTLNRIREVGRNYLFRIKNDRPATNELLWVMERLWFHAVGI